jgi:phosphoglycerol transferase
VILLLPNNAYTSFFMPESLYFFCFYCVALAFVSFVAPTGRTLDALISGIALAVLSLVKPHGLTILLACSLTLLYGLLAWRGERRRVALGGALMLLSFVVARGLLGSLAAPAAEGSLFERTFGLYANLLSNTMQFAPDADAVRRLGLATFNNVGSLLLLFGLPIVASAIWLARPRSENVPLPERLLDRIHVFVWILLICLVYGTIKFTAYIAGADASQGPGRIHERYYDFTFGLLLIAASASLRAIPWQIRRVRITCLAVVLVVSVLAVWYATSGFLTLRATWTDHPLLYAVRTVQFREIAWLPFVLVLAVVLVPLGPRLAGRVGALAFLLIGTFGFSAIWSEQAGSQIFWDADRDALALKVFYGPQELTRGLVVGENLGYLYRTSFYARSNFHVWNIPQHSVVDVAQLAPGAHWILVYGDYQVLGNWRQIDLPGPAILYQAGDDAVR